MLTAVVMCTMTSVVQSHLYSYSTLNLNLKCSKPHRLAFFFFYCVTIAPGVARTLDADCSGKVDDVVFIMLNKPV